MSDRHASEPPVADAFAAAVYGSVVATALVAALREAHVSSGRGAVALLSTMAVFWLVHVWSQIMGERYYQGLHFTTQHGLRIARAEWPLVQTAFAPAAVLLLGTVGILSDGTALVAALVVCGAQLVVWGFVVARRAFDNLFYATLSGLGNGVLGLLLVALETIVLH